MATRMPLPVCVATSSSPPRVARTLAVLDLAQRFGADVFTASQVARGKPAPDLYLAAAASLGLPPERCQFGIAFVHHVVELTPEQAADKMIEKEITR